MRLKTYLIIFSVVSSMHAARFLGLEAVCALITVGYCMIKSFCLFKGLDVLSFLAEG